MLTILEKKIGHEEGLRNWFNGPDSAGGISVSLSFRNDFSKTIKYITFGVAPYNAVGDLVESDIPGQQGILQYTGPLAPGATAWDRRWDNVFYNYSITGIVIAGAVCEFTDGTKRVLDYKNDNLNNSNQSGSGGCYIATCVYGSYNCPEVWTLRRYRDFTLDATWYGRLFIKVYYKISPTLVKILGNKKWFQKYWKKRLDRKISKLKNKGVSDTPYIDKY